MTVKVKLLDHACKLRTTYLAWQSRYVSSFGKVPEDFWVLIRKLEYLFDGKTLVLREVQQLDLVDFDGFLLACYDLLEEVNVHGRM